MKPGTNFPSVSKKSCRYRIFFHVKEIIGHILSRLVRLRRSDVDPSPQHWLNKHFGWNHGFPGSLTGLPEPEFGAYCNVVFTRGSTALDTDHRESGKEKIQNQD